MSSPKKNAKTLKELSSECLRNIENQMDDADSTEIATPEEQHTPGGSTFTIENSIDYLGPDNSDSCKGSESSPTSSGVLLNPPPVELEFVDNIEHEFYYVSDNENTEDAEAIKQTRICIKGNIAQNVSSPEDTKVIISELLPPGVSSDNQPVAHCSTAQPSFPYNFIHEIVDQLPILEIFDDDESNRAQVDVDTQNSPKEKEDGGPNDDEDDINNFPNASHEKEDEL